MASCSTNKKLRLERHGYSARTCARDPIFTARVESLSSSSMKLQRLQKSCVAGSHRKSTSSSGIRAGQAEVVPFVVAVVVVAPDAAVAAFVVTVAVVVVVVVVVLVLVLVPVPVPVPAPAPAPVPAPVPVVVVVVVAVVVVAAAAAVVVVVVVVAGIVAVAVAVAVVLVVVGNGVISGRVVFFIFDLFITFV